MIIGKYHLDDLLNSINTEYKKIVERVFAHTQYGSGSETIELPLNHSDIIECYTYLSTLIPFLRSFEYVYAVEYSNTLKPIEEIILEYSQWYKDSWVWLNPRIIQYIETTFKETTHLKDLDYLYVYSTATDHYTPDDVFINVVQKIDFIPKILIRIRADDLPPVKVTKVPVVTKGRIVLKDIEEVRKQGIYPESFLDLFQYHEAKVKVRVNDKVKEISPEVKALTEVV